MFPFEDLDDWFAAPWSGLVVPGPVIDITPDTIPVTRAADPPVYVANALAVAPESLVVVATATELGFDPTTVTSVGVFVRYGDGTTAQWSATSSATTDGITVTHEYVDGDVPKADRLRACVVYGFGGTGNTMTDSSGNILTTGGNVLTDGAVGGVIRGQGFTILVLE